MERITVVCAGTRPNARRFARDLHQSGKARLTHAAKVTADWRWKVPNYGLVKPAWCDPLGPQLPARAYIS